MPFKMGFSADKLEGIKAVPADIYDVAFVDFKPKNSKDTGKGVSLNFNGQAKIIGRIEIEGPGMLFTNLNEKIPSFIQDFVHSFGIEMENQESDFPQIPGDFEGEQDKPETWKYIGPLKGQTAQWEVGQKPHYKDPTAPPQNEVIRFICKVPNCAERFPKVRHSMDMRKKG